MAMPGLGDLLSAAATGRNQNQVTAGYQLNAARAADTFAQVPLRGAQTEEALAKASEGRLAAIAAQKKQDAIDRASEDAVSNGMDPQSAAQLGQALATGSNYGEATAGMGHLQEQGFRATLASPTASGESQRLAAQGVKGELQSPYLPLQPATVDARDLAPAGAPPRELDSNIGKATIDQKNAAADAATAKLTAGSPLDANDYAALAHLGNATGHDPAFGMGASPARLTYLRARALDAQGLPITAASLGLGGGGKAPAAAPAAAAPGAAPLSPAAGADAVIGRQTDVKAGQAGIKQLTQKLGMVNAQEVTALNNYDLMMTYAEKLNRGGGTLWNKALTNWKMGVTGDPETADFVSALNTAHDEYAKLRSGSTSAQGITDAGRKAADDIFNKNLNLDTLRSLRPVIAADAQNMKQGYTTAIEGLRSGITPSAAPHAAPSAPAAAVPNAVTLAFNNGKLTEGKLANLSDGSQWTVTGGKLVKVH